MVFVQICVRIYIYILKIRKKGVCKDNRCVCELGYTGYDCSLSMNAF